MANISVKFRCEALNRNVRFEVYMPNDAADDKGRRMKTLFLLHGYTGEAYNWVPEHLSQKYNFAVVTPNGENGFWLDGLSTGHKYCTFVGDELLKYIRRTFSLAMSREETYIMGLSMGGFGALHTALSYPESFGKAAAMSSALIVHGISGMKPGTDNGIANYDYYHECFGDLDTVERSDANPEVLAKRLKDSGAALPEIYMSCGTEDFLLAENREFHAFLDSIEVPHTYLESSGGHDMDFWNRYTEKFVEMMFGEQP
ncbi:MAG: alpha/beta hydrolase [Oscillospiraceae bacterium]